MREVARLRKLLSGFVTTFKRLFKSVWELYFVSYCKVQLLGSSIQQPLTKQSQICYLHVGNFTVELFLEFLKSMQPCARSVAKNRLGGQQNKYISYGQVVQ